jgi:hypothetical protein
MIGKFASRFSRSSRQPTAISLEAGGISDVGMRASVREVGMEIALATFPTAIISGRFLLTGDIDQPGMALVG